MNSRTPTILKPTARGRASALSELSLRGLLCLAFFCTAQLRAAAPSTSSDGQINVGAAGNFTVLTLGEDTDNTLTGPSLIDGTLGIAGRAKFSITDGDITGDVIYRTGSTINTSGPGRIHGRTFSSDGVLDQAALDAQNLSDSAFGETVTGRYAGLTTVNTNKNMTITGGPGEKVVLRLTDFVMTDGTFTLQGTATTAFIINISGRFALTGKAAITLAGVPPANVLFNIRGTGQQVSLNQGTSLSGILLATKRTVDLSGGKVIGAVVGNQVNITSGGSVVSPSRNR